MAQNLIEDAKKQGISRMHVAAFVKNGAGKILLIEELLMDHAIYRLPTAKLKTGETLQQALQRGIMEETSMVLSNVISYLGHYDSGAKRTFHFIIEVQDPYSLEAKHEIGHAWLEPQEAVRYPIRTELREMVDVYTKYQK